MTVLHLDTHDAVCRRYSVAAGLALLARDRGGPPVAAQVLVYPMLDDRTTVPDPLLAPLATWWYDDNATGWGALLGGDEGGEDVSPYAAPARTRPARAPTDLPRCQLYAPQSSLAARAQADRARVLAEL